jgi:hypothetical protein
LRLERIVVSQERTSRVDRDGAPGEKVSEYGKSASPHAIYRENVSEARNPAAARLAPKFILQGTRLTFKTEIARVVMS